MRLGIFFLVVGYLLSQFYRAFLAVLAAPLARDLGVGPDDLALASGLWFLTFALMQVPVGWALDTYGPRLTTALLLGLVASSGAVIFAFAQSAFHIHLSMIAIGAGCSPVLMAGFYIFARTYSAAVFATLAGAMIGFGSLGNILGALPLAAASEAIGWRASVLVVAGLTALVGLVQWFVVKDPPKAPQPEGGGGLMSLLRIPALWLILPLLTVNYAPAAGLRGVWAGPYMTDVFGASVAQVGQVTLLMAIAMIAGNFAYGPLDRVFGTRKWVVLTGNLLGTACLLIAAFAPAIGIWTNALVLAGIGFFGASFPMMIAHGRSFFPPHLLGRGVTLLNLFSIGGVGLLQMASGQVHVASRGDYGAVFLFFGLLLALGCVIYAFSRDRTD
ncbi:MAG: MFS transporter [Roseinatronobacter sp.]